MSRSKHSTSRQKISRHVERFLNVTFLTQKKREKKKSLETNQEQKKKKKEGKEELYSLALT